MNILFITSAHNSLSQRLLIELSAQGHDVSVALATSDEAMRRAVDRHAPELIVAPMLKVAIPQAIWARHVCLIMHPGIRGDRGPSSLDWAITNAETSWGVTVLQAVAEMDAGPVWASHEFALDDPPGCWARRRHPLPSARCRSTPRSTTRPIARFATRSAIKLAACTSTSTTVR